MPRKKNVWTKKMISLVLLFELKFADRLHFKKLKNKQCNIKTLVTADCKAKKVMQNEKQKENTRLRNNGWGETV